MTRKNTFGRTVCFGILATAAATMLMANTVAFAAGPGEESEVIAREEDHISGKVTDVSSDSITISVLGGRPGSGFERGMSGDEMQMEPHDGQTPPELPDGQMPPERPEGERPDLSAGERPEPPEGGKPDAQTPPEFPDGQTPPERPDGERPEFSDDERPELPEGEQHDGQTPPELHDGQTPPERPEGMDEHFMSGESGSEVTVKIDSNTVITKGTDAESGTLSDISVGSMVVISLDGDTAVSIMIMDLPA